MEEQKTPQESKEENTAEQVDESTVSTEGSESVTVVPNGKKNNYIGVGVSIVLLILVLFGLSKFLGTPANDPSSQSPLTEGSEAISIEDYPEVVAVVNGQELSREDFILSLTQELQAAAQQGADLTDPAIMTLLEAQALDRLVNTVLLIQSAKENNTEVSEEALSAEMERIASQFETQEAFEEAIAQQGITPEGLREDVEEQLLVNNFLSKDESLSAPSVSQEEIQQTYDQIASGQEGVPPLEDVSAVIAQQLATQKQQELIGEFIQSLRESAEIETNL